MRFLAPLALAASLATAAFAADDPEQAPVTVRLDAMSLPAAVAARLEFVVGTPWKVNGKAPRRVRVGERRLRPGPGPTPVTFQVQPADVKDGVVEVEADYFVCEDRPDAPCFRRLVLFEVPISQDAAPVPAPLVLQTPENP